MRNGISQNKGITLIALVITIIVLLILAGVSMVALTGENGVLTKASKAKTENAQATAKEKVQVAVMGSFGNDGKVNNNELKINLEKIEGIDKNTIPTEAEIENITDFFEVTVDGYTVKIDKSGKVTVEGESTGGTTKPPVVNTIAPGQMVTGGNKEYINNGTAVIPEGFMIVPGCDDVSQGLVISDDAGDTELDSSNIVANGNQFVWVPVTNMDNFKRIEGYSNENLQSDLSSCSEPFANGYSTEKTEYDTMKQRVEKNQGFFIGRYEAGRDTNGNLVVKKNSPVYHNIKWGSSMSNITGGAVQLSKNFTNGKSYQGKVTSTLCYGVQWDATMQFLDNNYITGTCEESSYVRNSTDKGNYSGSLINTGSNENYKVKNIYDMAGNVYEWTMEARTDTYRLIRGGSYSCTGADRPASVRGKNGPSGSHDSYGFRLALIESV